MRSKKRFGFTLIEALVIVAVLAIVVGIVLPVMTHARDKARHSHCQSNIRMIGLGFAAYFEDSDGRFPPVTATDSITVPDSNTHSTRQEICYGWAGALQIYLRSTAAYKCPCSTISPTIIPTARGYTDFYYNSNLATLPLRLSRWDKVDPYFFNSSVVSSHNKRTNGTRSALTRPEVTILVGEGYFGDARYNRTATEHGGQPIADERHFGGGNYVFCDGHVKWVKREQIFNGAQPATEGTKGSPTNLAGYAATHLIR